MPTFQPFELERIMSKWEQTVEYNLSESGAHPATLRELLGDSLPVEELLATELNVSVQGVGAVGSRDGAGRSQLAASQASVR